MTSTPTEADREAAAKALGLSEHALLSFESGARIESVAQLLADQRQELVEHLQQRRRETLVALRANVSGGADYWRWQGHAEMSRQLLERMGAEVPR